jgi:hypothetical protein
MLRDDQTGNDKPEQPRRGDIGKYRQLFYAGALGPDLRASIDGIGCQFIQTHRIVATRELTGRSKTRNEDDRPSGSVSWRPGRRVPQAPGSGDGKTVANSGQIGRLVEARCYLPLNNG